MIGEREAPKAARQVEGLCLGHPKISGSWAQNLQPPKSCSTPGNSFSRDTYKSYKIITIS